MPGRATTARPRNRPAAVSSASGMTARASAAASAEMTWLPCPPARWTRTRPRPRGPAAPSVVALGFDAHERAPAVALRDRLAEDGAIDGPEEVVADRPASRIAGRTKSSNVTADDTGLPGSPNSRTGGPPPGRGGGAERERLARLDGDAPEVDPGRSSRWRSSRRRTARPKRHPTRSSASAPAVEPVRGGDRGRRRGRRGRSRGRSARRRRRVTSARSPGPFASGIPAGPSVCAGRTDLVARRKNADPGPAVDQDPADTGTGEQGDSGRRSSPLPGRRRSRPPSRSLPAARTEPPGGLPRGRGTRPGPVRWRHVHAVLRSTRRVERRGRLRPGRPRRRRRGAGAPVAMRAPVPWRTTTSGSAPAGYRR